MAQVSEHAGTWGVSWSIVGLMIPLGYAIINVGVVQNQVSVNTGRLTNIETTTAKDLPALLASLNVATNQEANIQRELDQIRTDFNKFISEEEPQIKAAIEVGKNQDNNLRDMIDKLSVNLSALQAAHAATRAQVDTMWTAHK